MIAQWVPSAHPLPEVWSSKPPAILRHPRHSRCLHLLHGVAFGLIISGFCVSCVIWIRASRNNQHDSRVRARDEWVVSSSTATPSFKWLFAGFASWHGSVLMSACLWFTRSYTSAHRCFPTWTASDADHRPFTSSYYSFLVSSPSLHLRPGDGVGRGLLLHFAW